MKRTAKANWLGDLQTGLGSLDTQSGILVNSPYSFKTRFGDLNGTNPEELLAASHAGCFTMSVSLVLTEAGFTAGELDTEAIVELDMSQFKISSIHLNLKAAPIPGVSRSVFEALLEVAKAECIISNALSVPISVSVEHSEA